jgi:hypothetical protein
MGRAATAAFPARHCGVQLIPQSIAAKPVLLFVTRRRSCMTRRSGRRGNPRNLHRG